MSIPGSPLRSNEVPITLETKKMADNLSIPYKRKGFGALFGILFTIIYFYCSPAAYKFFWSLIEENIPKQYQFAIASFVSHTGVALISNIIMYIIYKIKLPFFERYRVSDKPWLWESDPKAWSQLLKKTFKFLFIAHVIIVPGSSFIDGINGIPLRTDIEDMPDLKEILTQFFFFMLCEDFLFYWTHRLLHHPRLYPHIHKIHHEYNITVTIAAEYAHPIEYFFGNMIPANIGAKILGKKAHYATYLIWISWRLIETADAHSGYEFPWSPFGLLPMSRKSCPVRVPNFYLAVSSYHSFHHSQNVGNYGSFFTVWDTIFGTNKKYYEYQAKKEKQKELDMVSKDK